MAQQPDRRVARGRLDDARERAAALREQAVAGREAAADLRDRVADAREAAADLRDGSVAEREARLAQHRRDAWGQGTTAEQSSWLRAEARQVIAASHEALNRDADGLDRQDATKDRDLAHAEWEQGEVDRAVCDPPP